VLVAAWIWLVFIFAFGCCIGSFLNVVIYRLPRDKSLISPPSACPACGKHLRFYDNIPLISWLLLGRKCRYCKAAISPRYFVIELLTGVVFTGLFFLYFHMNQLAGLDSFVEGGWLIYSLHITLIAAFIAASAIDLELWVIPIYLCWFVTLVGIVGSAFGGLVLDFHLVRGFFLLPSASSRIAALALGALIGLIISWLLLITGVLKRSYHVESKYRAEKEPQQTAEPRFKDRLEVCWEILFLLPVIICSVCAYLFIKNNPSVNLWWLDFSQQPLVAGLMGSLWGYFVGCAVVWTTRILGTIAFNKEAMGLGDVHLMGAAGAVIGPVLVVVAFFIAPFFGLIWVAFQMFFKKIRQIPYGPFLSIGVFVVIIFHDWIYSLLINYLVFKISR
jgi:leader peptidase (prepilin peptidase)/N-methyltransferase